MTVLTPLRAVAAHGLQPAARVAAAPFADQLWGHLLRSVGRQRLHGLLARAIADGALPVTEQQALEVAQRETEAACAAVRLERALLDTVGVLDEDRIPSRVLKGSAVAHLDYAEPELRDFGDVDLLLPASVLEEGLAVLIDAGCTRPVPELAPGFDRRFGKGATLRRPDGIELDIHRMFVAGAFGMRIDFDESFETGERFDLGGRQLIALDRSERFLHACYHAALGAATPRLVAVRDVAEMVRHPQLDWSDALTRARSWGGEAVVARALRLCTELLEADIDAAVAAWASAYSPSARDRRAIEACLAREGRFAQQSIGAIREVRGTRAKLGYLRALAVPRRAHLAGRARTRSSHVARAGRRLRQRWGD